MVYQGVTMFKRKLSVILAATLATTAFAAKYEAESATLSGGATPGADNSASGSKFVNMNEFIQLLFLMFWAFQN